MRVKSAIRHFCGVGVLSFVSVTACGDGESGSPVSDAGPDSIDARRVGETCDDPEPIALANGERRITASTVGLNNDHNLGACAFAVETGPDRVYSITMPAGQRLQVDVIPQATAFDIGLFLVAGPAANCDAMPPRCLAESDYGGDGGNELITFNSPAGQGETNAFVVVDGVRPQGGPYILTVRVGP